MAERLPGVRVRDRGRGEEGVKTVQEALEALEQIRKVRDRLTELEFSEETPEADRDVFGLAGELLLDYFDMIKTLPLRRG